MKPFNLFLFFTTVLLVLGIFSWITPQEGWNVFGLNIRFLKLEQASIAELPVQRNDTTVAILKAQIDSIVQDSILKIELKNDSSLNTKNQIILNNKNPKRANALADSLIHTDNFIDQISKYDSTKQQLRVLYYGDSQIENDRITSTLRYRLQQQFGGSGRGLVPITDIYNSATILLCRFRRTGKKHRLWEAKVKTSMPGYCASLIQLKNIETQKTVWKAPSLKLKP